MANNKEMTGLSASLSGITSAFKSLKWLVAFCVLAALVTALCCVYYVSMIVQDSRSKVYVLDNGAAFSATMKSSAVTRSDEIRDHLQSFHDLFFNLPPDLKMIEANVERALNFADKSAYKYYDNLRESGFYKNLVNADAFQQIAVDSVKINVGVYPYQARVFCSQWITRSSNMSRFALVTQCRLMEVPRSPKNLHGLMITEFEVVENRQLETRNKNF